MNRKRRVTLTIEHREVSISVHVGSARSEHPRDPDPGAVAQRSPPGPAGCSVCGAACLMVEPWAAAIAAAPTPQVIAAFLDCGLHPPLYANDRLWVCSYSLEQLKEKL